MAADAIAAKICCTWRMIGDVYTTKRWKIGRFCGADTGIASTVFIHIKPVAAIVPFGAGDALWRCLVANDVSMVMHGVTFFLSRCCFIPLVFWHQSPDKPLDSHAQKNCAKPKAGLLQKSELW